MLKRITMMICVITIGLTVTGCTEEPDPIDDPKTETYTVVFDSKDGEPVDSQVVTEGDSIDLPDTTKEGYTLLGWTRFDASTASLLEDPYTPSSDITLYAKWDINSYTITFDSNGGTDVSPIVKPFNMRVSQPEEPTKEGFVFGGWYTDSELVNSYPFDRMQAEDITLYAKWNYQAYTIFFNTDGGSYIESLTESYMTDIDPPNVPVKNGYAFGGWYTNETFDTVYIFDTMPATNMTLYAKWNPIDWSEVETYLASELPELVTTDIDLPSEYLDYTITWQSEDRDIIREDGTFERPYQATTVGLIATIVQGDNMVSKTFDVSVDGYKSLDGPIASSYIYRNYYTVDDLFFETLDIINCAFIYADANGNLSGTTTLSNINTYIMQDAKEHGNWVLFSISPSSEWSDIASSATKINDFADNIVSMINSYGFDGVDIDWETPTSSETQYFVNMMEVIYTKVKENNTNHLVTAAVAGGMWQPPRYNLTESHQYLDYINMMTYSMVSNSGYYQNALYESTSFDNPTNLVGKTLTSCSIEESVEVYNSYGIPNSKIIVGVPFYAVEQTRTYNSATGEWSDWGYQTARSYHYLEANYLNSNDWTYYYDENAGVPYLLKNDGTTFVSFDDRASILEISAYIIAEGLGGMMYWEHGHDINGTLLQALNDGLK